MLYNESKDEYRKRIARNVAKLYSSSVIPQGLFYLLPNGVILDISKHFESFIAFAQSLVDIDFASVPEDALAILGDSFGWIAVNTDSDGYIQVTRCPLTDAQRMMIPEILGKMTDRTIVVISSNDYTAIETSSIQMFNDAVAYLI